MCVNTFVPTSKNGNTGALCLHKRALYLSAYGVYTFGARTSLNTARIPFSTNSRVLSVCNAYDFWDLCICTYICLYIYIYIYMNMYVYKHIHMYMHIYICEYIHIYIHMYIHISEYIYMYIYACTYTYTYNP